MKPIPKGSTVTAADMALLGLPSIRRTRCIACGDAHPDEPGHHHPFRSHIPKALHPLIPIYSLCGPGSAGGCHGLMHSHEMELHLTPEDAVVFIATHSGAKSVNARRKANGLRPVEAYVPFAPTLWGETL